MDGSTPGLPVHHQLPEFTETHVHWVGDAIQPPHPLSSPSPPNLQSFPASGSFQRSELFTSGGQSIGVSASASVLPVNIQDWFPLGWTGLISLQSKGLWRVFSNTTFLGSSIKISFNKLIKRGNQLFTRLWKEIQKSYIKQLYVKKKRRLFLERFVQRLQSQTRWWNQYQVQGIFALRSACSTLWHKSSLAADFIVHITSFFQGLGFWIFLVKVILRGVCRESGSQGHSYSLITPLISVETLVTLVEQILSAFSQFPNERIYFVRVYVYFQLHYRFIMSSKRQSYFAINSNNHNLGRYIWCFLWI